MFAVVACHAAILGEDSSADKGILAHVWMPSVS